MSSVDNRIVKMVFDNEKFEAGVSKTLDTLDKLKEKLTFKDADKTFKGIEVSANNVDFGGIESGVESLKKRFSTMGIVGMEVTRRITNAAIDAGKKIADATLGQIKRGGMTRALNIEQAEFRLKAFGYDVKEIMKNANEAVTDTAYGLDEAAGAASVLAASGVKAGQEMTDVLKSISGAAAMTGRSYSDIADIYSTVAGNGKLMTEQLRQFTHSNINVAKILADAYGSSEAEMREAVTKGEVSFEMFSKAMQKFGDDAKKANDTYTGSLSNLKAALSRIGEMFASPFLVNARYVFHSITAALKETKKALEPFAEQVSSAMKKVRKFITEGLNKLTGKELKTGKYQFGAIGDLVDSLVNSIWALWTAIKPIKKAFTDLFPKATFENLAKVIGKFKEFTGRLELNERQAKNMEYVYKAIFSIFKLIGTLIGTVIKGISRIFKPFGGLLNVINFIVGAVGRLIYAFITVVTKVRIVSRVFTLVTYVISGVFWAIRMLVDGIVWVVKAIAKSKPVVAVVNAISTAFQFCVKHIKAFISRVVEVSKKIVSFIGNAAAKAISKFANLLYKGFQKGVELASKLINKIKEVIGAIKGTKAFQTFVSVIDKIKQKVSDTVNGIKNTLGKISGIVGEIASKAKNKFVESFGKGLQLASVYAGKLVNKLKEVYRTAKDSKAFNSFVDALGKIKGYLATAIDKIRSFVSAIADWVKQHDVARSFINILVNGLKLIAGAIVLAVMAIKDFAQRAYQFFKDTGLIETFTELFHKGFDKIKNVIKELVDKAKEFGEYISGNLVSDMKEAGDVAGKAGGLLKDAFNFVFIKNGVKVFADAFNTTKSVGEKLIGLLKIIGKWILNVADKYNLLDKLKNAAKTAFKEIGELPKKFNLQKIADYFPYEAFGVFLLVLSGFIKKAGKIGDAAKGVFESISGYFDALSEKIKGNKWQNRAKTLIMFAAAIYILAKAIQTLGSMNIKELGIGLGAVVVSMALLVGAMVILGKVLDKCNSVNMAQVGLGMILIAGSMFVMAKAIEKFASLDTTTMWLGLVRVGAALLLLTAAVKGGLGDAKNMASTGAGLLLMAGALFALSSVILLYSTFDWTTFGKGLLLAGAGLAVLALSVRLMGQPKGIFAAAIGMNLMVLALLAFAGVVKIFSKFEFDDLKQGLGSVVILLASLVISIRILNGVDTKAIASGILLVAAALAVIAVSVKVMGGLEFNNLVASLAGLIVVLITIGVVLKKLSEASDLGKTAASILLVSAALAIIALAVSQLGDLPFENILASFGGLAVLLLGMYLALQGLGEGGGKILVAAASFLIMSAAIAVLSVVLMGLAQIPFSQLASGIGALALALLVIVGAGLLAGLGPVTLGLLALSVALLSLGATALMISNSIMTTVMALEMLSSMGPEAMQRVVEAIVTFAEELAAAAPRILAAAIIIGSSFIAGLVALIPQIAMAGVQMIIGLMSGIAQNIGTIVQLAVSIIVSFILGIASMIGPIVNAGILLMIGFIRGLADGIRNNSKMFFDALSDLLEAVLEMVLSAFQTIAEKIPVIGDKISKGLEKAKSEVKDAFKVDDHDIEYGKALDKAKDDIQSKTPDLKNAAKDAAGGVKDEISGSMENLGIFGEEGMGAFAGGITNGSGQVIDASALMSEEQMKAAGMTPEAIEQFKQLGLDQTGANADGILSGKGLAVGKAEEVNKGTSKAFAKDDGTAKKAGKKKTEEYAAGISPKTVLKNIKDIMSSAVKAFSDKAATGQIKTAGTKTTDTFAKGVEAGKSKANTAGKTVASNAASGAGNQTAKTSSNTAGLNLGQGFVQGLAAKEKAAYDAGYKVGAAGARGEKDGIKSHSPSKLGIKYGKYLGEGFVIGLTSMTDAAYNAGYNVSDTATNALTDAMTRIYDTITSDVDFNPTITPVLDLSNIQNGVSSMNSMLDTAAVSARVSANMRGVGLMPALATAGGDSVVNNNSNTFNITVDGAESPEAFADRLVEQINLRQRMS